MRKIIHFIFSKSKLFFNQKKIFLKTFLFNNYNLIKYESIHGKFNSSFKFCGRLIWPSLACLKWKQNVYYFLKNDKNVSLSTENWYNLAKINVGIPKYFDKAIKVYRSEYEKNYVQKVEKRG